MELVRGQANRCGIFLFFDRDGIVDDYIINMLLDLKKNLKHLLVVCNGYVTHGSLHKLRIVADEIICRANVGFDVGGYREGIFYLGWKELRNYDELIMVNYTFYGPLYPFEEMFQAMDEKDINFWGITKHHKVVPDPFQKISYGFLPEHIQSHFLALRKDLFMSYQYRDFICNMKNPTTYTESICNYEAIFTKYFEDLGFTWEVYVDTSEYEEYAYNPLMFYAREVIERKRCPIIKRRSFFTDYNDFLLNSCGESSLEAYAYIQEKNLYDLDLIWENLLRLENLTAVHRALHLNYILESYATSFIWDKKIAIIIIVENTRRIKWYKKYMEDMPIGADFFLYGSPEDCKIVQELLKQEKVRTFTANTCSYMEALKEVFGKIETSEYDYVGIARVRELEAERPYSNMVSWQYADWENLFGNKFVIGNLLDAFENNPRMGMCIPPVPCYGNLFAKIGEGWCGRYEQVKKYLECQEIKVNISYSQRPLTPIGGSFWVRGSLVNTILKYIEHEDEELFLLALPFLIQAVGKYTGIGYSDRYVPIETTNQDFMLRENNKVVFKKYGASYHKEVVDRVRNNNFDFGEGESDIGAG